MEFIVDKDDCRLDKFLAEKLKEFSRTKLQRFIEEGGVKASGRIILKPGLKLKRGTRIVLLEEKIISPEKEFSVEPAPDIPLSIIYEDDGFLVVNKPAGLLTHPTLKETKNTLANALVGRYPDIIKVGESVLRPGIVHRLDRMASGLLIAAKTQKAFDYFKKQFLERKIEKKYLVLVEGAPKEKQGIVEYAIKPSKYNRLKKVALRTSDILGLKKSARAASTYYKTKKIINNNFTLLEVAPLTGRTHQIRVHLSAIGHPVVGDRLYGAKKNIPGLNRIFLHAYYLKFIAPNGESLALETELPEDLQKILTKF